MIERPLLPGEWADVPQNTRDLWCGKFAGKKGSWGHKFLVERGLIGPNESATAEEVSRLIGSVGFLPYPDLNWPV